MKTLLTGIHPTMAEALKPLFARTWQNWVVLDDQGRDLWVVYAPTKEDAVKAHPLAVDARPMEMTEKDLKLARRAADSYGSLD